MCERSPWPAIRAHPLPHLFYLHAGIMESYFHLKLPFLEGQSLSFPLMCRNKHDPVIFLPQALPAYMLWVTDLYLCEEVEIKRKWGSLSF